MSLAFISHADLREDQLRAAWTRMRPGRDHWPTEFNAAMQDALISRVLRIAAGADARKQPARTAAHAGRPVDTLRTISGRTIPRPAVAGKK